MKKSNKLLLGGLLTLILLIVAMHIALYAKYKNGDYTIYHPEDELADIMKPFPGVSFVTLLNVYAVNVRFGDKAEVEKGEEDVIQAVQKGDTLIITGQEYSDVLEARRPVNITLPPGVTLSAFNSSLRIEKGKQAVGGNPVIYLQKSHAVFLDNGNPLRLGQVKLIASDSSVAAFLGNTWVDYLDAQLSNSILEYNEGDAGGLSIVTDSVSRISLQSKHLLKAKITTIPTTP
ncbi:MAG: hypothetical protein ABW019_01655 [Chitinophagaceae bacterium]